MNKSKTELSQGYVLGLGMVSLLVGIPTATKLVEWGLNPYAGLAISAVVFAASYWLLQKQTKKLNERFNP
jgi:hypothetical protein